MNAQSSRSHSVLILSMERRNRIISDDNFQNGTKDILKGKLFLVDLCGSERLKKTEATGIRKEEAKFINLSLSALSQVMNALETRKDFVPFRNSKLTRLLQESLSGRGKTSIIVCIGPSSDHAQETISSLLFGSRAMRVQTTAQVFKDIDYKSLSLQLQRELDEKDEKIKELENILEEELGEIELLEEKNKETTNILEILEHKLNGIEEIHQKNINNITDIYEQKLASQEIRLQEENNRILYLIKEIENLKIKNNELERELNDQKNIQTEYSKNENSELENLKIQLFQSEEKLLNYEEFITYSQNTIKKLEEHIHQRQEVVKESKEVQSDNSSSIQFISEYIQTTTTNEENYLNFILSKAQDENLLLTSILCEILQLDYMTNILESYDSSEPNDILPSVKFLEIFNSNFISDESTNSKIKIENFSDPLFSYLEKSFKSKYIYYQVKRLSDLPSLSTSQNLECTSQRNEIQDLGLDYLTSILLEFKNGANSYHRLSQIFEDKLTKIHLDLEFIYQLKCFEKEILITVQNYWKENITVNINIDTIISENVQNLKYHYYSLQEKLFNEYIKNLKDSIHKFSLVSNEEMLEAIKLRFNSEIQLSNQNFNLSILEIKKLILEEENFLIKERINSLIKNQEIITNHLNELNNSLNLESNQNYIFEKILLQIENLNQFTSPLINEDNMPLILPESNFNNLIFHETNLQNLQILNSEKYISNLDQYYDGDFFCYDNWLRDKNFPSFTLFNIKFNENLITSINDSLNELGQEFDNFESLQKSVLKKYNLDLNEIKCSVNLEPSLKKLQSKENKFDQIEKILTSMNNTINLVLNKATNLLRQLYIQIKSLAFHLFSHFKLLNISNKYQFDILNDFKYISSKFNFLQKKYKLKMESLKEDVLIKDNILDKMKNENKVLEDLHNDLKNKMEYIKNQLIKTESKQRKSENRLLNTQNEILTLKKSLKYHEEEILSIRAMLQESENKNLSLQRNLLKCEEEALLQKEIFRREKAALIIQSYIRRLKVSHLLNEQNEEKGKIAQENLLKKKYIEALTRSRNELKEKRDQYKISLHEQSSKTGVLLIRQSFSEVNQFFGECVSNFIL